MRRFGLIGYPLAHSFSKKYFNEKFENESIDAIYELYEIASISQLTNLKDFDKLSGFNVTIPYKEEIFQYLDETDPVAAEIGAVNTVKISRNSEHVTLKGYNTDIIGFRDSIEPHIKPHHSRALILGTGGASKAVRFVLAGLGLETKLVSRTEKPEAFTYSQLTEEVMHDYTVIVNTTPVGTFPHTSECPEVPYLFVGKKHLLFDAIYNPTETLFLKKGKEAGATCINGLQMLRGQAEAAWTIWNS